MAAAAREDDAAASNRKAEEEDSSPEEAAHQKTDLTMARPAADVDECSDDEDDDPIIRNLNLMARRNLMTPEWIENAKKNHCEHHALIDSIYDALENGEIESDSDGEAAQEDIWASVDLSGLNTVYGEYAVAVYPVGVYPLKSPSEDEDHDAAAAAAAAESSS